MISTTESGRTPSGQRSPNTLSMRGRISNKDQLPGQTWRDFLLRKRKDWKLAMKLGN